jgi:hypothetical protein
MELAQARELALVLTRLLLAVDGERIVAEYARERGLTGRKGARGSGASEMDGGIPAR